MIRILNVLAIIALSGGLIAAATYLAISGDAPAQAASPDIDFMLQKLADLDQQISLDAEKDLLKLGEKIRPDLERAAKSGNARLASRARKLLDALSEPTGLQ